MNNTESEKWNKRKYATQPPWIGAAMRTSVNGIKERLFLVHNNSFPSSSEQESMGTGEKSKKVGKVRRKLKIKNKE